MHVNTAKTGSEVTQTIKQNISFCVNHWWAHILFKYTNNKATLTMFEDVICQILEQSSNSSNLSEMDEDKLTEALLTLPTLEITYIKRSKIASRIS